tara:strand:+ start:4179 stop:5735 length:1557 start_codon:yes stop_codon:yes gene_type:complete
MKWLKVHIIEISIGLIGPPLLLQGKAWFGLLAIRQMIVVGRLMLRWQHGKSALERILMRPARLMVSSFGGIILLGTALLMMPAATKNIHQLPFIDALFTATSATCVTGLAIMNTPEDFTLFGQLIILGLIQVGGLGIMTLSSFIIWLMGRRLGILGQHALGEILDEPTPGTVLRLLRFIVIATFLTELVGALILYFYWIDPQYHIKTPFYHAIFHSISAFCNAGFALWGNSLVPFQTELGINVTIMALIVLGGIGFPVLASISSRQRYRRFLEVKQRHSFLWSARMYLQSLPLNTKIVLIAYFLLLVSAFFLFLGLEWQHSLKHLSPIDKCLAALFQAVTLRTAGFNTVDYSLLTPATMLMMIFFMIIGGASGGTAGGLKVNTLAILYLSLSSTLRGRKEVEVFERTLPQETILKATAIISVFTVLIFLFLFALALTHPGVPFLHLFFEVSSAIGTVGLTVATPDGIGTTSKLNFFGKLAITFAMFLGRLGPLTLAFAVGERITKAQYKYPQERVYVG